MAGKIMAVPVTVQTAYGQCGGNGWTGVTTCVSGYYCTSWNDWYSQCVPGAALSVSSAAAVFKPTTSVVKTSTAVKASAAVKTSTATIKTPATGIKATSTTAAAKTSSAVAVVNASSTKAAVTSTASASSSGKVKYGGINIAGFDFGCGTDGTCNTGGIVNPGTTGVNQIKHFITDDGLNAFRLPVGWQYLVNNNLGGTLDATNWNNYDALVQGCLSSGAALCIVDIHNYARWNGAIIGQGGPTNAQFSSLWTQIATKYGSNTKIAFGLMNEPHDVDIATWATTVQAVVTAVRAIAPDNIILLPGNNYAAAGAFISNGSGAALLKVTNPDGSTTNLIFDVHAYLDSDNSGTHTSCATNNIDNAFAPLATWLRSNNRQAFLSETGGGPNDSSCITRLCEELAFLNTNSDVFAGFTGWAAGMFDTSYTLSMTPNGSGSSYTDQPLVKQCVVANFA
ncbi:glycoside hydrolase family 5 protein [Amniculicola lignicola CBS 123094]|uniref:Endoglucanase EG-II n=1 Tax=Amniculicola lignicola CBS 123094 TaxID=1392246 RepID=A0A6A5WFI5_9PLEO|nr:glycoside hydrolase family 5 protein [Amniculicola lignicola CBS 123094]